MKTILLLLGLVIQQSFANSACEYKIRLNSQKIGSFYQQEYPLSNNLFNWLNNETIIEQNKTLLPSISDNDIINSVGVITLDDKNDMKYKRLIIGYAKYINIMIVAYFILGIICSIIVFFLTKFMFGYRVRKNIHNIIEHTMENQAMYKCQFLIMCIPIIIVGNIIFYNVTFIPNLDIYTYDSNKICKYCLFYSNKIDITIDLHGNNRYCMDNTYGSTIIDKWLTDTYMSSNTLDIIMYYTITMYYILFSILIPVYYTTKNKKSKEHLQKIENKIKHIVPNDIERFSIRE
jgi:hypothetical protein